MVYSVGVFTKRHMICLYPLASIVLQYHAMGQTVLCSHSQSVKVWYFGIPTFCNCILFEHARLLSDISKIRHWNPQSCNIPLHLPSTELHQWHLRVCTRFTDVRRVDSRVVRWELKAHAVLGTFSVVENERFKYNKNRSNVCKCAWNNLRKVDWLRMIYCKWHASYLLFRWW